ncbi:MAG: hypothetical protein HN522_05855 [Flavobacteriales bacterium]|jgi:hypothetical protein|nr:hypothetical protein [Flavobacteriales bacterium]MBT5090104.1 hypothetical protein [Flavobacteriales bacterium]MBT5750893.1 hypothetical protein [Flavobacteriales bacterium]
MSAQLLKLLEGRVDRKKIITILNNGVDNKGFNFLVSHMQKHVKSSSWRSAWIINNAMDKNDIRLKNLLTKIIQSISDKEDGHQRELLKVVMKMEPLNEDAEGYFFDVCINLWEEVNKQPAVRYYAGCYILTIATKYPEIKNELGVLFGDYYIQSLSPGIKQIFERKLAELN